MLRIGGGLRASGAQVYRNHTSPRRPPGGSPRVRAQPGIAIERARRAVEHGCPLPSSMFVKSPKSFATAALALLVGSCASYPDRTRQALSDFQRGQLTQARAAYQKPSTTHAPFLAGAEAGMVALAAGDWDGAIQDLGAAAKEVADAERSALISPESLGETILTWTLNEGAQAYHGEGYERVLVHTGLAIAYLAKGDLEDARVEVRQSNALLE